MPRDRRSASKPKFARRVKAPRRGKARVAKPKATPSRTTGDKALLEIAGEMLMLDEMRGRPVAPPPPPLAPAPAPAIPNAILDPVQKLTPGADKVLGAARIRCEVEAKKAADPERPLSSALLVADRIESAALATLPPGDFEVGVGGELVPHGTGRMPPAHYRNTINSPSYVTAEASRTRLDVADQCGVLETTLDLCDTIEARDSSERMLAGQMAVLHKVSMLAGKRAAEALEHMEGVLDHKYREIHSVQAMRMVNAMSRASAEFQNCMTTFQKMRSGGKQNITVTHVQNTQVNDGGLAVVTTGPGAHHTGGDAGK